MSGLPNKTVQDMARNRKEYLDTLALRAKIDDYNLQGNKLYTRTGTLPVQPTDTRTTSEKLSDLYGIRTQIRSELLDLMSGDEAQKVVQSLDDNEATFLASMLPTIKDDLKPKFSLGVPSAVFIPYLQKMMKKFIDTKGIDYPLQQTLADGTDLGRVLTDIKQIGLDNTALGKSIKSNIETIEAMLDYLPEMLTIVKNETNSILKDELTKSINDIVEEFPSKSDITNQLIQLDTAIARRDIMTAQTVLQKINELTTYAGDLNEQLLILKRQMEESSGFGPEAVKAEQPISAIAEPVRSVQQDGLSYSYTPVSQLSEFLKIPSQKTPNKRSLYNYFRAMRQINPTLTDSIGIRPTQDKNTIIQKLTENDSTVRQIWSGSAEEKPVTGSGMNNRMSGKGLKKQMKVDMKGGMLPNSKYVPFGNYLINQQGLEDGILQIKRHSGQFITDIKTKRISNNLTNVFKKITGGEIPSFNDYEKLDDDEREYLQFVARRSNLLDKLKVPTPKKDKTEQLINQFEIMRGQVLAGNDSKDMLKKFKEIIIEMSERKLIPRSQVTDLLLEIAKFEI